MATVIEPVIEETHADQVVTLREVGWKGYKALMRLRGERPRPRMVYLDGTVYLMSPSYLHDVLSRRLMLLVVVVSEELDIPCTPAGTTTFRRKPKRGGVEGDESFYIANAHRIVGKKAPDLRVDPPPDLAIEAVYSHAADAALEVYRRLRVPEVWVAEQTRLSIRVLDARNRYRESASSLAFPYLSAEEIHAWIVRDQDDSGTAWTKALRAWVRQTLKPRAAALSTQ